MRGWAFALSAALHVLAIALYPRLFGRLPTAVDRGAPDAIEVLQGMELVNLVEVEDALDSPDDPQRIERVIDPSAPTRVVVPADPTARPGPVRPPSPPGEGRTAVERLQPNTADGRLWEPIPEEILALTPEQRMENLLYARLQSLNDSAAAEAARAAGLTDWTYTDGNGDRWGVSPGKLHLGPVTLPLPFSFGMPPGATDDRRRAAELDAEIRRAAGQSGVDETLEERARAIRERRDRERTKPDTTRSGG